MAKSPKKILIIDDDSRNIFALNAVLSAKGFQCVTATSALAGIAMMDSVVDIGIVLLDMMMPEMDGYEALGVIRSGPHKDIPVVSLTAQAMVGDREKCLEAGADDYIAKPVDIDRLLSLLHSYLK